MLSLLRRSRSPSRRSGSSGVRRRSHLRLEELEPRTLLDAYTPGQIRHAYGFDKLTTLDGMGQTIAIVVAYHNPNASYDLQVFDAQYGLPDPPSFTVAMPQGQPSRRDDWALETDLDVQWAHAIAPGADILLVEARSASSSNLLEAVDYARRQPGVVVVSMSWGGNEFPGENQLDGHFTTPTGHIGGSGLPGGVTFVAASGDTGGQVMWPSASPNVLSVGGTSLDLDALGNVQGEWGWWESDQWGSGGGPSRYYTEPAYQLPFQSSGARGTPDVAYNGDRYTGVSVYDSNYYGDSGFFQVGGTSAGAPQWAGLIALADQGRALRGIGSLDGPGQTLPALYGLAAFSYSTYYNDITYGGNPNGYQAGPGYDFVTGIGSPFADQVVQGLVVSPQAPPGGNQGLENSSLSPFAGAGWKNRVVSPLPHRVEPVPPPLPGRHGSGKTGIPPEQGTLPDSPTSRSVSPLLAGTADAAPGGVRAAPAGMVPASTARNGLDRSAAGAVQPVVSALPRLPEGRVESGGGENAAVPEAQEDHETAPPATSPRSSPDARRGAAQGDPSQPEDSAALWRRASDICFAGLGQAGDSREQRASVSNDGERLAWLPDPLVAVGALVVVLGGSWGKPSPETSSERRRFSNGSDVVG